MVIPIKKNIMSFSIDIDNSVDITLYNPIPK